MDPLADHVDFHYFPCPDFLHFEFHCRARLSFHPVGCLLGGQSVGGGAVDLQDLIAAAKSVPVGRAVLVGLVDDDVAVLLGLVDDCSDASVGLRYHQLEILIVLLRDVDRVRVEAFEHRLDAGFLDSVQREGVHVGSVQLVEYGVVDLGPLPDFEGFRLCGGCGGDGCHHQAETEDRYSFHVHCLL